MDLLNGLVNAFASFDITTWLLLVGGVITGMIVGVLPGLTFVMGVLLILPFTYGMEPESGVILMLAVYTAGTYGGALTSILLHIPGEPNNVPLLWDGHNMARRGRAAEALGWTALAALVGGLVSWLVLAFAAKPFARLALQFTPVEYCVIVLIGLVSVLALVDRGVIKAMIALLAGMLLASVGVDEVYGSVRFDLFNLQILRDGVDYLAVMIGVYALGDVIKRFAERFSGGTPQVPAKIKTTIPGLRAIRQRSGSFVRGAAVGSLLGGVPGAGATVASFVSYGVEKNFGKYRSEVGQASPGGVIAPQAASTATVGAAFVPLLVLGIPGSAATAVILGALLLHNVQPGPQIFATQPELVYSIIAALLASLVIMFVVGLLASKPMVRLLQVPEPYVAAFIVLFAYIGSFALRNSISDVWIMVGFAALGFFLQRGGIPLAPLVLGAILGPLAETYYLTAMISSGNDLSIFLRRPISAGLIAVLVAFFALLAYKSYRQRSTTNVNDAREVPTQN